MNGGLDYPATRGFLGSNQLLESVPAADQRPDELARGHQHSGSCHDQGDHVGRSTCVYLVLLASLVFTRKHTTV